MTDIEFSTLFDMLQSIGFAGVFLFLYVSEKKAHEETRKQYRGDLREVAGFHSNIRLANTLDNDQQNTPQ